MTSSFGKETVIFFEIIQPLCARRYGDAFGSPTGGCTAQLGVTGTRKCYNSRVTCQDPDNYSPGTLTLRFTPQQDGLLEYGTGQVGSPLESSSSLIPSLLALETTPAAINLAAMDRSKSALGEREVVTVELEDHQHSDLFVDPYRLQRPTGEASGEYAAEFAAGDVVTLPNTLNFGTGSFTVEGWTRHDDYANPRSFFPVAKYSPVPNWNLAPGWGIGHTFLSGTTIEGFIHDNASPDAHVNFHLECDVGYRPIDLVGLKAHVIVRFDRTNGVVSAFVNGKKQGSASIATITGSVNNTSTLQIGNTVGWQLDGAFDELRIYTRAITDTEAFEHYDDVFNDETSLAGLWKFDEGSGTTVLDNSGNSPSLNGTKTGGYSNALAPSVNIFDPYEQGTFWGKWLARNPYHANYQCRVREGYIGDALDEMRVRTYTIDRIDGPQNGSVKLIAKDLFSKIEARKAVAPTASRGELLADITDVATTATLSPSGIGELDYPAMAGSPSEFYVAIGDEVMRCSRSGDVLTFLERGALDTVAAAHDEEDLVQWVLAYTTQLAHVIAYDLLTNYSEIPAAQIDFVEWAAQAEQLTELYTTRIAKPTPVNELIGELSEQAGFTIWADPVTNMIEFVALRASTPNPTVTDNEWIVDGTFASKLQIAKRASEVWVYYGQKSPVENLDERRNFRSRLVVADLDAEAATQYGTPAIREVFSRWIPQFGRDFAENTGNRLISMFRDPPLEAEFAIHVDRDGELNLARFFYLEVAEIQDDIGVVTPVSLAATQLARGENEIMVKAQEVSFAPVAADTGERVIYIENDAFNLNMRTVHDSLYTAPTGGSPSEQVRFIIIEDVTVGSLTTATPSLRTGSWPANVVLTLENRGRIQGRGGDGGSGGLTMPSFGSIGQTGGDALLVESILRVDNQGQIWSGGGGGGGTDEINLEGGTPTSCGGGGAAGTEPGNGGSGLAVAGNAGTTETGGTGGSFAGLVAGNGGGPGLPGTAANIGGAGGIAGKYISGIALVILGSPQGDLRGNVS